jgi:hypothetical protein
MTEVKQIPLPWAHPLVHPLAHPWVHPWAAAAAPYWGGFYPYGAYHPAPGFYYPHPAMAHALFYNNPYPTYMNGAYERRWYGGHYWYPHVGNMKQTESQPSDLQAINGDPMPVLHDAVMPWKNALDKVGEVMGWTKPVEDVKETIEKAEKATNKDKEEKSDEKPKKK